MKFVLTIETRARHKRLRRDELAVGISDPVVTRSVSNCDAKSRDAVPTFASVTGETCDEVVPVDEFETPRLLNGFTVGDRL